MSGPKIRGVTIQLGGDTTGLSKAFSNVNKDISNTQKQLKDVERLLKLDPTNTTLLAQKQKLLGNALTQTKSKLETLKSAEAQVQAQFEKGEGSQEQYMALKREIIATEHELADLEKAAARSNVALEKIGATADKVATGTGKVAQATKRLSATAAGTLGTAAAGAISFEDSFAKVTTLLVGSEADFEAYKEAIIAGSNETSISVGDYAEAVYAAISASIGQADAVQFTTAAAKTAKGGFTDLTKAVDILTTTINGYGLSAKDAEKISDLLINTQNQGKTTVDELASSMGAVIPIASSASFSLEELAAGYALMTKNGIATSEAGTYMKSMLSELTKSGSTADKTLREMTGLGFAELHASGVSTSEILQVLATEAEESGKTLKDMFGSVEAGSAALMLSRKSGKEFEEMLDSMNSAAGVTKDAYEKVSEAAGAKMKKSLNELMNTGIRLGEVILPVIDAVIGITGNLVDKLANMDEGTLMMIATVLAVIAAISPVAGLISGVATAVSGVSSALTFLAANPVTLAIAAVAAFVAVVATSGDDIRAVLQGVDDFLQGIFAMDFTEIFGPVLGTVLNSFMAEVKAIWDGFKSILDGIIDFVQGVFSGNWEQAWTGIQEIFGGAFGALTGLAKAPLNGLIGMVNKAIDALNSVSFDMPDWLGGGHFGINLPHIPMLANGGILSRGSAIVGEAGPELLTVAGGQAVVQPLSGSTGKIESLLGDISGQMGALGTPQGGSALIQIVLDGDVIGQVAYDYAQRRTRAYGE